MRSNLRLLLKQFTSPIELILIAATLVSMVIGDVTDGLIILAIVIPSGLLSFWQEHRASKAMAALLARVQVHVEVIRNGVEVTLPISEVVVGDEVILRIGDIIPGDMEITKSTDLQIDESALTGESFATVKQIGDIAKFGTHVASGTAVGVIRNLGADTEYGALEKAIASKDVQTGFERGMTKFGLLLVRATVVLLVALFVVNIILKRPIIDSLLFSIALAVGLTPQLLPAIISVSLTAGAKAMSKKQVLVKRLDAIEDFGAMNILCTDKTGTITAGVINLDAHVDLSGESSGRVLRLALLNASLQQGFKNPLDESIISSAAKTVDISGVRAISEIAYDFERKRLSVFVEDGQKNYLITKGAFDNVLALCSISESDSKSARALYEKYSAQGNRVIAVATGDSAEEKGLRFEGLLLFMDPPKEGAVEAVQELSSLGIVLYLFTGDNALAAKSIAGKVGLRNDNVVTGAQLAAMNANEVAECLESTRVFAAVSPLQKQDLVGALRAAGNTVGFFGDGINDSAAIHAADVGISVDTAVDIAKHEAAIVLLAKDLSVIAEGVRLGRKTFINTMKYVRVGVSAAFGNMFSMAIASVFLPFLPLLPIQILLLNFLTDFPALAISADSVDAEQVEKPRTWDIKDIRNFMILFGLISSVFDILTFVILRAGFNAHAELFRSGWFIESTLTELAVMLVLRTRRRFWMSKPGFLLWLTSLLLAVVVIAIPYSPLGGLLKLEPLPIAILLSLFGLIAAYIAINEQVKRRWVRY